mgnify:CR=1 FL=1
MLKRNKKNVLIGVCALAGVALTSVGFATWVVGVTNKESKTKYNLKVDDVASDTIFLSVANESGTINIGEKEVHNKIGNDIAGTDALEKVTNALSFEVTGLTIKIGTNVADKPTKLHLKLENTAELNTINKVATASDLLTRNGAKVRTGSTDYYYLELTDMVIDLVYGDTAGEGVNMVKTSKETTNGYYTYEYNANGTKVLTKELGWGNYFGNVSPVKYYNKVYEDVENPSLDNMLASSKNAYDEISAMKTALDTTKNGGSNLTISVSLDEGNK